jgi:uncharacterized protein YkwD
MKNSYKIIISIGISLMLFLAVGCGSDSGGNMAAYANLIQSSNSNDSNTSDENNNSVISDDRNDTENIGNSDDRNDTENTNENNESGRGSIVNEPKDEDENMEKGETDRLNWMDENLSKYLSMEPEYSENPDEGSCTAGLLSKDYTNKMLELINEVRKLHNLSSLEYDYYSEASMQEASLMMSTNNTLSHEPTEDWKCYTSSGSEGAATSNLAYGHRTVGKSIVTGWLWDSGVSTLGHRRWILAPSMTKTSFGLVKNGSAMKTFDYTAGNANPVYIAYPYLDYPRTLLGESVSSFSVNDGSVYHSITKINGPVIINGESVNFNDLGDNYGSGATISWDYKYENNKEYTITIKGIENSEQTSYTYKVKIIE